MFRIFSLVIFLTIFYACKKEPVHEVAPSLIGVWKHYSEIDAWHIIHIYDNGEGRMEWFTNGKTSKVTKTRKWYMKDNTIYFGKLALNGEFYEVFDFPVLSSNESIQVFDTLHLGKRYMRLKAGYYVEM